MNKTRMKRFGESLAEEGFLSLPIHLEHTVIAAERPLHHGDPFDRMLIAQAQREGLTIVTADAMIRRYAVAIL